MISGGAVPESVVNLRVLKSKKRFIEAQILDTVKKSPLEQELPAHFQIYGGCKWLPIAYEDQLRIKSEQIREAFHSLEKYWIGFEKSATQEDIEIKQDEENHEENTEELTTKITTPTNPPTFHSIVPSPEIY